MIIIIIIIIIIVKMGNNVWVTAKEFEPTTT